MKPETNQRRRQRRRKQSKEVKPDLARPVQQKMFLVPERNARVPDSLIKELSPHNDRPRISYFESLSLLYQGKLVSTIVDRKLVKLQKNSTWLKCIGILEGHGMSYGVHIADIADALGIKVASAQVACRKAQQIMFDLFGFHVGFFTADTTFKLATDKEVAIRHRTLSKEVIAKAKRLGMYATAVHEFAQPCGTLQIELFCPLELPDGDAKSRIYPN